MGIEEALKRLNEQMVYAGLEPVELLSCGGASLNLMGLISRSTGDVDIISVVQVVEGAVRFLEQTTLPPQFSELVARVGGELGIKEEWLNFGPAPLLVFGLPEGLAARLERRSYGKCLTLHVISRFDQIHLKLYAVMHPGPRTETHLGDLMDLEPTEEEARAALKWLLDRKTSTDFRRKLKAVLDRIGHERLAQTF